jgi:hypothetical protein
VLTRSGTASDGDALVACMAPLKKYGGSRQRRSLGNPVRLRCNAASRAETLQVFPAPPLLNRGFID